MDTGRPIYISDGFIPQVERFASKFAASRIDVETFNTIISTMCDKAEKATGNKFVFIVNDRAWHLVQQSLGGYLANFKVDATYLWSKQANGYVKVGATFDTYEYGGNQISFKVDRALTREFGSEKAYMICVDLTADAASNTPAVASFALKGKDFIYNKILGVGGLDGMSSGIVSSPVAGSKLSIHGLILRIVHVKLFKLLESRVGNQQPSRKIRA